MTTSKVSLPLFTETLRYPQDRWQGLHYTPTPFPPPNFGGVYATPCIVQLRVLRATHPSSRDTFSLANGGVRDLGRDTASGPSH